MAGQQTLHSLGKRVLASQRVLLTVVPLCRGYAPNVPANATCHHPSGPLAGHNASELYADVVKLVSSKDLELKKLVYMCVQLSPSSSLPSIPPSIHTHPLIPSNRAPQALHQHPSFPPPAPLIPATPAPTPSLSLCGARPALVWFIDPGSPPPRLPPRKRRRPSVRPFTAARY